MCVRLCTRSGPASSCCTWCRHTFRTAVVSRACRMLVHGSQPDALCPTKPDSVCRRHAGYSCNGSRCCWWLLRTATWVRSATPSFLVRPCWADRLRHSCHSHHTLCRRAWLAIKAATAHNMPANGHCATSGFGGPVSGFSSVGQHLHRAHTAPSGQGETNPSPLLLLHAAQVH